MKKALLLASLLVTAGCASTDIGRLTASSDPVEARSLFGEPLRSPEPSGTNIAKFEEAKQAWLADPDDPMKLIWYGRRAGYLGNYQDAIAIFSEGMRRFPDDARMPRHRGHRYISTRQFDRAIADYEKAYAMIQGQPDAIEPDGMPNAQGIPLTTTHGNIRYHLGLAYYLVHDYENARRIYAEDLAKERNDDGIVAASHWLYMINKHLGNDAEAEALLTRITPDMNIIENFAYHKALLVHKGVLSAEDELPDNIAANPGLAGLAYGIANYYRFRGNESRAFEIMNEIVASSAWSPFGYIAAEADLAKAGAHRRAAP